MSITLFALTLAAVSSDTAPAAPTKPLLICRASERQVGSRIRKGRKCRTADEWALEDAERDHKPAGLRVTEGQSTPTGAPTAPR